MSNLTPEQRAKKNARNKAYYHRNKEQIRQRRIEKLNEDPDAYRAHKNSLMREWRDKNREKQREYYKEYYRENRESVLDKNKKWADKSKEEIRNYKLLQDYGINLEEYNELLKIQDNRCAICNLEETTMLNGKVKALSVDHCHDTNEVRGLLCAKCNFGIGLFNHNSDLLEQAILFLNPEILAEVEL